MRRLVAMRSGARGAQWISGGAIQKGCKALASSSSFDCRLIWIAGFSLCTGVVCGACILATFLVIYLLWSA